MNANEWHWARLKKDLWIDDSVLLNCIKSDLFIMPENMIVWARTGNRRIAITINNATLKENFAAFQIVDDIQYSDLLEPLE